MNNTIHPGGVPVSQPSTNGARPAAGDADGARSAPAAANPAQGSDRVQLTESALAMGAAGRSTDAPVDTQRVERIRQAIADGSYQVDPQNVADRLIALERQIG